jgi:hypothetical protein
MDEVRQLDSTAERTGSSWQNRLSVWARRPHVAFRSGERSPARASPGGTIAGSARKADIAEPKMLPSISTGLSLAGPDPPHSRGVWNATHCCAFVSGATVSRVTRFGGNLMGRKWGIPGTPGFWSWFLASYRFHRHAGGRGRWRSIILAWRQARAHY